ncbi:MAG: Eco57I restriction-modification methylase domain-containing protein [Chloroflexi bacterium]|nr:Eco57I restriction-modification methylase domain-containing protein [Chloroflexota bacterium]
MPFSIIQTRRDLQAFDLKKLFIEKMGWDLAKQTSEIQVDGQHFQLTMVAQKRGLAAFVCSPMPDGSIPDSSLRAKIETQVRKLAHEHLIIFTNGDKTTQKWQWVRREPNKPIARREYDKTEIILQRLQSAIFELDEEEDLTIIEVGQRLKQAFDVEKVTKKFYDRFQDEHTAFLKFIKGIPDKEMQRWYVSVTLNRLMFIYFIQKKQFLENDPNYLRHHLEESKKKGKDLFYSDFLCPLFFDGFAKKKHNAETKKLLGNIPYLNGGIFERHQIEEMYGEKIQVPDKAFEQLFAFFDDYRWHLDERPNKADNEINPDVLGYIFEKYINQKQMGAYYTKEDITEYITKNTIIPYLFDVAQKECKIAFEGDGSVWRHLQADPDRYIYAAVRYGVGNALPTEIAIGESDPKRREGWNEPAPEEFALPTEIWREVVARRRRYQEVKEKLAKGEVRSINDLITLNLDIRQFAQDVIEDSDADLLAAFWKALTQIKILDPTVGSGAFLFAALNVLEPLYEACLERMSALVEELDRSGEKHSPKKYEPFRKALEQVRQRPDEDYFIFKSIIINNLYGVDIMEEAVEICKLRLFLKLASQVEPDASKENLGIEPLPDIDFNIRAGNTLVGFATREDVKRSVQFGTVGGVQSEKLFAMPEEDAQLKRIEEKAEDVDRLYKLFRQQQTEFGGEVRPEDKRELQKRLGELEKELNVLLAKQYAIHNPKGEDYKKWLESHTPFHWFVEFFGIMNEGGFDVIIGNPPYVEYRKVRSTYQVQDYKTEESENLYVYVIERSLQLISSDSRLGLIVPISLVSVPDNYVVRRMLLNQGSSWFSNYAIRPAKLFEGVEQRLTICLVNREKGSKKTAYSTKYNQWFKDERPTLFEKITYSDITVLANENLIPKSGSDIATRVLGKISSVKSDLIALHLVNESKHKLYFHRTPGYWIRMMDFLPYYKAPTGDRSIFHTRELSVSDLAYNKFIGAVVNSTLYFFHFFAMGNCRNLTLEDVKTFALGKPEKETLKIVGDLFDELMKDFNRNSFVNHRGPTEFQEFDWDLSKPIIDEIDRALARHYGLSDEELDFIINYDVKYRMGASAGEEGEGE